MSAKTEQQIIQDYKDERDPEIEYDGIRVIQEFMRSPKIGESPININLSKTIPISLPPLLWHHHELPPKKMKSTNTGHTLIMSAKWHQERPFVSGGPLFGNYVFSQLHFHWGKNDMEGSEHTVDGSPQPLEMHVVLFKSCYLTQEAALKKRDGILVLVYFFKLQAANNVTMELVTDAIPYIQRPHSSARLDPLPLSFLTVPFEDDYFMYWGTVTTTECVHMLLWLISREPIGISIEQLETFRTLLNVEGIPLQGNFRPVQDIESSDRTVFHANPSTSLYATLLPIRKQREFVVKKESVRAQPDEDKELAAAQIFRMEHAYGNPFKDDKKDTNCNKYTINTSIKVDPDILAKLKGANVRLKDGQLHRAHHADSSENCIYDTTSLDSDASRPTSGMSKPTSAVYMPPPPAYSPPIDAERPLSEGNTPSVAIPETNSETNSQRKGKKPSLIPRRIK